MSGGWDASRPRAAGRRGWARLGEAYILAPPPGYPRRMAQITVASPKVDERAQTLWQEVAAASDEIAAIVDNIPGLTVTGAETRGELERAASLLKAVADILRRTER